MCCSSCFPCSPQDPNTLPPRLDEQLLLGHNTVITPSLTDKNIQKAVGHVFQKPPAPDMDRSFNTSVDITIQEQRTPPPSPNRVNAQAPGSADSASTACSDTNNDAPFYRNSARSF